MAGGINQDVRRNTADRELPWDGGRGPVAEWHMDPGKLCGLQEGLDARSVGVEIEPHDFQLLFSGETLTETLDFTQLGHAGPHQVAQKSSRT